MTGVRRLRVSIDVTQVDNQSLGSGQFRYAVDLVSGLAALDAGIDLTLLGSTPEPVPEFRAAITGSAGCRYVQLAPYGGRGYYYRDLSRISWWLATHPTDVFHQIHTNIPPLKPCAVVVTAYHYLDDPLVFATRPYRYYLWALSHRADLVLPISNATRDDFHLRFGVPLARMRTVHLGLSPSFAAAGARPRARRFLLSPYNLSLPKNLRSLIAAWSAIAERYRDLDLILYGRAHVTPEAERAFEQMLSGLAHADRIHRVGHLSDRALAGHYAGCELFIFPTTVEGFGYPLLEAMAHGACCITRDASAMREIGGDAVRLVETLKPGEISAAAIDLLADPSLRASLGERARRRASAFTIEAMSRNTLECYRTVASRGGHAGASPGPA